MEIATGKQKLVVFLLGNCGGGKSSLANRVTATSLFKCSRSVSSVTHYCQSFTVPVSDSDSLMLVDTPGLGDTTRDREEIHKEILKSYHDIKSKFPDAKFALALVVGAQSRLLKNDLKEFGLLGTIFGLNLYHHSFIIWTHADILQQGTDLVESFHQYMENADDSIKSFANDVRGDQIIISNIENGLCFQYNSKETYSLEKCRDVVFQVASQVAGDASRLELRGKRARRMRQMAAKVKAADELPPSFVTYVANSFSPLLEFFSSLKISFSG